MSKAGHLAEYVEAVVLDFAVEIDPDDRIYPDHGSLSDLRIDLMDAIDGCVGDWQINQRVDHEEKLKPPEPDPDEVRDRMRNQKMLGIDVPDGVAE